MDGTTCKLRRKDLPKFYAVAKSIEKEFKVTWEFAIVEKMVFSNTNSYISKIQEEFMLDDNLNIINHSKDLNKIKRKGSVFRYGKDIPLGDSTNMQVIPKALEAYFLKGVDPSEFIRNPEKYGITIFDYCCSKKVSRGWKVFWGDEPTQNFNRYYFVKTGKYLLKARTGEKNMHHFHKDCGVKLLNKYNPDTTFAEYGVNYDYYVAECRKKIDEIEVDIRQLDLFSGTGF